MRRLVLLLSTAVLPAATASAEVTLSGTARLGIGYGVLNNGDPWLEPTRTETVDRGGAPVAVDTRLGAPDDELRALSRVRFVFTGVGESDSGITFGASIRADNAPSGGTGPTAASGQTAGSAFVAGAWGTLTYGDVDGADYQRVGDPIRNVTLTGLGDFNELPFLSNGGGTDNDELQFLADPDVRPTVRYDYDIAGREKGIDSVADPADQPAERPGRDDPAADPDSLLHRHEVRRSIQPGAESVPFQNLGQHGANRAFSVCTGDVDELGFGADRIGKPASPDQLLHPVKA